ncbi:MAG: GGDEF domain-containing protein [Candidatus Protistobacter heckmanni]|nr:GGDEF domain-containing protein [Candidatus Protistobacter heckmanni]
MDVDHVKLVNDRFGHLFGDEVLPLVANEIRRTFHVSDKLFRFGGEEFIVLLRQVNETQAMNVIDQFRRVIASHAFPQVGKVTISIGLMKIVTGDNITTALGRADDALYYAKQHGRNHVRAHEMLTREGSISSSVQEMSVELF